MTLTEAAQFAGIISALVAVCMLVLALKKGRQPNDPKHQ
jgi:hypothetical protein